MKETHRPCEAPYHAEDCNGLGETLDHFTAKAIAKLLGWSHKEICDEMNLQYLSQACHRDKDRTTPGRIRLLRKLLRGDEVTMEEYQELLDRLDRGIS